MPSSTEVAASSSSSAQHKGYIVTTGRSKHESVRLSPNMSVAAGNIANNLADLMRDCYFNYDKNTPQLLDDVVANMTSVLAHKANKFDEASIQRITALMSEIDSLKSGSFSSVKSCLASDLSAYLEASVADYASRNKNLTQAEIDQYWLEKNKEMLHKTADLDRSGSPGRGVSSDENQTPVYGGARLTEGNLNPSSGGSRRVYTAPPLRPSAKDLPPRKFNNFVHIELPANYHQLSPENQEFWRWGVEMSRIGRLGY